MASQRGAVMNRGAILSRGRQVKFTKKVLLMNNYHYHFLIFSINLEIKIILCVFFFINKVTKIWGETQILVVVGLRGHHFAVPKQSLWRGPRLQPPQRFWQTNTAVAHAPLTYSIVLLVESGGTEGMRPLKFKSLEGTSPRSLGTITFSKL